MKIKLSAHESGKINAEVLDDNGKRLKAIPMRHFTYQAMMYYLVENGIIEFEWVN